MSSFTASQVKSAMVLQRELVEQGGLHPVRAGILVRNALDRVALDFGLGKVWQTRRVRHELPGVAPRIVLRGET
jgi:hypothetical protein